MNFLQSKSQKSRNRSKELQKLTFILLIMRRMRLIQDKRKARDEVQEESTPTKALIKKVPTHRKKR